jgi:protein-S-isoprenylcysteine O-methyltransferase Ste14
MPLGAGMVLALLAIAQFAQRRTTLQTDRVASSLVSGGVFALSRNPMYLAIMLALSGEAFCLGTLSPWLAPAVMAPLLHCYYIPAEEAMLLEAFGDEYRRYQAKVRRWI